MQDEQCNPGVAQVCVCFYWPQFTSRISGILQGGIGDHQITDFLSYRPPSEVSYTSRCRKLRFLNSLKT